MIKKLIDFFKIPWRIFSSIERKLDVIINENKLISKKLEELEWANIYHDSIKGRTELNGTHLYPGRWAANYSFLYILIRILYDAKPESVLEFGLGESSKLISTCVDENSYIKNYTILEHDNDWIDLFKSRYDLSMQVKFDLHELGIKKVFNEDVNSYKNIDHQKFKDFVLYVVDGPFGSNHYSRFDIVEILKYKSKGDEFIVLLDDYNRPGEIETVKCIKELLQDKQINFNTKVFEGVKSQFLIATKGFSFLTSI